MPNFIMFVRANDGNEGPQSPPPPSPFFRLDRRKINTFTSSMAIAGVLVSGDGFSESSKGARVHFSSSAAPTVTHGPFDAPSPVSGHWIIKTDTLDDAIEWAKKAPFKRDNQVVEIREICTLQEFGFLRAEMVL